MTMIPHEPEELYAAAIAQDYTCRTQGYLKARCCNSGEGGSAPAGDPGVLHHLMQAHSLLWLLHQNLRHNIDIVFCAEICSLVESFFMSVRRVNWFNVDVCILQLLPKA